MEVINLGKTLHKLQYLRRRSGLSQEEVASMIGLSVHGYRKLEQGVRRLTMDNALKLKKIFGLQYVDELFDDAV